MTLFWYLGMFLGWHKHIYMTYCSLAYTQMLKKLKKGFFVVTFYKSDIHVHGKVYIAFYEMSYWSKNYHYLLNTIADSVCTKFWDSMMMYSFIMTNFVLSHNWCYYVALLTPWLILNKLLRSNTFTVLNASKKSEYQNTPST